MLDAIYVGLAFGAVMALLLEFVGHWERLSKFPQHFHSWIHRRGGWRVNHRRHWKPVKTCSAAKFEP